MKYLWYCYHR